LNKARKEKPDIVVLDLMLPGRCGEEACKEIRKDDAIGSTPVIMLTAKSTDVDAIIGKVIGADAYIIKPFDVNKLLAEVNRLVKERCNPMKDSKINEFKSRLLPLLKQEALKKGKFVLSSGSISNYYLDGRIISLSPEGAYLVASIILEFIKGKKIYAVGGPTLGADPIVGAVAALSHINHMPIKTFIVRKSAKGHGTGRQIEGPALKRGSRVILVDDVATTGKALIEAKEALEQEGVIADTAIVIVDRDEGAKGALARAGLRLESIFRIKDLGL
jgi:orotate phosphoribosyltransferase